MRQRLALTTLALVLAASGTAVAAYEEGSQLEVDAPARLVGRADALVEQGFASLVSADAGPNLDASVTGRELTITHHSIFVCDDAVPSCNLVPGRESGGEAIRLHDATLRVTRVVGPYKVVVSNAESLASPIVATTGGAQTTLDATREPLHLSPYSDGWTTGDAAAYSEPVYAVDADESFVESAGGTLAAAGDLELLFQGVEIEAKGTDDEGDPVVVTYRTARTSESGGTRYEFLVVEASGSVARAASAAEVTAMRVRALDLPRGRAEVTGADGAIVTDGARAQHEDASLTLQGPLEMLITDVAGGRLAFALSSHLRVLDGAPIPPEEEDASTGELVAAGAAGAGGAALLAAGLYFWPRLKFGLVGLALPLYTRIQRTEVLEHEKRDEIYSLIRDAPGIHAHEIGEKARIGWGTTVYHLKLLEQHNLVVSKKSGRYKRFFVNTGEYTKKKDVYGALRNETAKAVADYIATHPGASQKDLCAALGIQPSLASWHVQKLEAVELVKRVRDGRQVRYFAGPAWTDVAPAGAAPAATSSDADEHGAGAA